MQSAIGANVGNGAAVDLVSPAPSVLVDARPRPRGRPRFGQQATRRSQDKTLVLAIGAANGEFLCPIAQSVDLHVRGQRVNKNTSIEQSIEQGLLDDLVRLDNTVQLRG